MWTSKCTKETKHPEVYSDTESESVAMARYRCYRLVSDPTTTRVAQYEWP